MRRVNYVWIVLSALTVLAWGVANVHAHYLLAPNRAETLAVLAIAAVKSRLVVREYMEVRTAPAWLRRAGDAWLIVLMATLAVMYVTA